MSTDNFSKLIELADSLVYQKTGQHLETVDKDILQQALSGKKLSAIRSASYEDSYVQRFRAPKLWNLLSVVTGEKVRKKTVRETLIRLEQSQSQVTPHSESSGSESEENSHGSRNTHAALSYSTPILRVIDREALSEELHEMPSFNSVDTDSVDTDNSVGADATAYIDALKLLPRSHYSEENNSNSRNRDTGSTRFTTLIKPGLPLLLSAGVLSSVFALSWLANWYGASNHLAGRLPIAQFGYSLAAKLNPLSPAAHYNQGAVYEDQQNYAQAHDEYQKAIEGGLIEAYNNQARLYILQGKHDAAVSLLQHGLPLASSDHVRADMLKNRGWARLEQARFQEATLDLRAAIDLNGDRASAHCLLAQALERQGNKANALTEWETCLGLAYQPGMPEEDKWMHLARQRLEIK